MTDHTKPNHLSRQINVEAKSEQRVIYTNPQIQANKHQQQKHPDVNSGKRMLNIVNNNKNNQQDLLQPVQIQEQINVHMNQQVASNSRGNNTHFQGSSRNIQGLNVGVNSAATQLQHLFGSHIGGNHPHTATQQIPIVNKAHKQSDGGVAPQQKRARRLRKNFDMIAQAMKTQNQQQIVTKQILGAAVKSGKMPSSVQRDNHAPLSSEPSRNYNLPQYNQYGMSSSGGGASQYDPHNQSTYSQVHMIQNFNNRQAALSAHQNNESQKLIYGGANSKIGNHPQYTKERKISNSQAPSGYYDMLIAQSKPGQHHSQSQRAASSMSHRNNAANQLIYHGVNSIPSTNHNTSMFSQISLRDGTQPNQFPASGVKNSEQTRNQSSAYQGYIQGFNTGNLGLNNTHNMSHQIASQPLNLFEPNNKSFHDSNAPQDKLPRRYGLNQTNVIGFASASSSRKSNENLLHTNLIHAHNNNNDSSLLPSTNHHPANGSAGQAPILNINTASDINIYNNSFIVNTNGIATALGLASTTKKPQSNSQNNSRSNSLKRNISGQNVGSLSQIKAIQQPSIKQQIAAQGKMNINSAVSGKLNGGNSGGAISLQNLLIMNNNNNINDYRGRDLQLRNNSKQILSATGGRSEKPSSFSQIAEAYTTTNFFGGVQGGLSSANIKNNAAAIGAATIYPLSQQQQKLGNPSSKKMIKLTHRKQQQQVQHQKQQSSSSAQAISSQLLQKPQDSSMQDIRNQQPQSYTQCFQNGASSLENFGKRKNNSHSTNGTNSKVKNSQSLNRLIPSQNTFSNNNTAGNISREFPQNTESSPNIRGQNKSRALSQNLLLQGKKKVLEKDYPKAIALFSEAIELDQSNNDAKFYRALSQLDQGFNKEAIEELKHIITNSSMAVNAPACHILLSIAYKRINEPQQAIAVLGECIKNYPTYSDSYLARGQALLMNEKYSEALLDFQQYTQIVPQNGVGYLGVGDSHKALKQWQKAITAYSKAIQLFASTEPNPSSTSKPIKNQQDLSSALQFTMQATLKRGLCYYHLQLFAQAMVDFQAVLKTESSSIKAHFYIGKILSKQYLGEAATQIDASSQVQNHKQKLQNEAILHFEQVVKYHQSSTGEVYAGNALFEIAKLRLHDKDFYEAYFNLKRAVDSNFSSKRLQLYKDFTEGVLYLIKRKIKKGVQILSDLLEVLVNSKNKKDQKQLDYLKHQSYLYRAYGYVAIEKYEVALQDIKKAKKLKKLDAATVYNKLLGKGILRMDHEDYLMATKYFTRASQKFPTNKDSYCLYIISIVRSYTYSHAGMTIDQEEKREKVLQAKAFMDHAIERCDVKVKVPSLYFFRGLLHFQLHMFTQALNDFNVAIDEEEEPTASYFLARGRTYACLSILTEAMKDLSIALNLDETLQDAYIYRGKCAYLLGDNNLAFLDFQRLILTDPKNPIVHVFAGNLLMTTGAYQDAIKAFLNADTVQQTAVAAFQRARCYCALTDLENAKMQFKIALQLCKSEELIKIDSQVLTALMRVINAVQQNKSALNNESALKSIKGAIEAINTIIEFFQSDQIKQFKKKDSQLNIQIIPNVKRIKIEKLVVAKELHNRQLKEGSYQKSQEGKNLPDISLATEELLDQPTIGDLDEMFKDIPAYSYYFENVFSLEDLYLFRAVFEFYSGDYLRAVADYEQCQSLKYNEGDQKPKGQRQPDSMIPTPAHHTQHITESMLAYSNTSTPMLSMNSSKTDLSDVGLCSLNVHETNYNILICYLMMKDYKKAMEKVNEIIGQTPPKYQKHFFLLRGLLFATSGQTDKAAKDFSKYEKQEPKSFETFFKEGRDVVFEPFPIKSRLCSRFENVKVSHIELPEIFKSKKGISPCLLLRPSFSMPFIKPPNMIPNIDEEAIQGEFTLKQIDAPMPEAPWIRRWSGGKASGPGQEDDNGEGLDGGCGIKFTDHILNDDEDGEDQDQNEKMMIDEGVNIDQHMLSDDISSPRAHGHSQLNAKEEHKQHPVSKKVQPFQDESPYLQSIETNPQSLVQRLKTHQVPLIGEQIIKQTANNSAALHYTDNPLAHSIGSNAHHAQGMMIYQFVGDVIDVDQLSDKHKISLFDESRYEGDFGTSVQGQSLQVPEEYKSINNKMKNQNRMILKKNQEDDSLAGGDSLFDERLINNDEDEAINPDTDSDSDDDEDEEDDEVESSGNEQESKINKKIKKSKAVDKSVPSMVGESMVLMGENVFAYKLKNKRKQQANAGGSISKKKRPLQLGLSTDGNDLSIQNQRKTGGLDVSRQPQATTTENKSERESIFRSRPSTKR